MGSVDHGSGHFLCWHTRDSQATEVILTPLVAALIGHTVHLTIHALGSLSLAFLAEEHDRVLGGLFKVDLNAVEGVLDDGGGHEVRCVDELSIGQDGVSSRSVGSVRQLSPPTPLLAVLVRQYQQCHHRAGRSCQCQSSRSIYRRESQ